MMGFDIGQDGLAEDAVTETIRASLVNVHVAQPGVVLSFDPASQTATVVPALRRNLNGVVSEVSALTGVPVMFPRCKDFAVTFPIQAGDAVLLVFADRSLDNYLGGDGDSADPQDTRLHDLSDAIAIPGFGQSPILDFNPESYQVRNVDNTARFGMTKENKFELLNQDASLYAIIRAVLVLIGNPQLIEDLDKLMQ